MRNLCANCGPTEVEVDDRMGHTVCVLCGNVMEMNTIVSEVTFTEQGNGSAMADGFSVSSTSARAKSSGKFGLIRPGGQEPREQTMQNGHRRISEIASQPQIRMAERHIQSAQRFFNLAVMNNFTKGRKSGLVVAACLYVVCRMEKTAHMLIDFADALSINVFQIGATFLKLVQLLHIPLPIVDPSLYITRFADRLDYGDKTLAVVKDANRLAQRMNRDWLQTGRRPAGICAASLFISSRIHGFHRTHREIILVVKICENTLRKRLSEFSSTPSGNLTVDEFQTLWLEEERDPPAFTRARETKKQHQSANTLQSADKSAQEMATQHQDSSSSSCLPSLVSESLLPLTEEDDATLNNPQDQDQDDMDQDDDIMAGEQIDDNIDDQDSQQVMQEMLDILQSEEGARLEKAFNSLGSRTTRKADDGEEEGGETLSDLDDDREVQNMLAVSTEEVEFKTLLWTSENQEWMDSQEAKRQQRSEKDLLPKSASQSSKQRKRPKKPSHRALPYATSAAEAARNLIDSKPALSRKINYTVLDNLFDESVASTTPSQLPLSAMD